MNRDSTDPRQNFGFLVKDVSRLYTRRFEERAGSIALSLGECKALAYLAKYAGVSQKRLAELIEVEPMTLVRMLDRMEADGWVERRSDPEDRRARSLVITEKAKPLIEHIWRLAGETRAEAFDGFSDRERVQLLELLERAHVNLLGLKPLATGANSPRSSVTPHDAAGDAR